ncbi:MAG: hypothetical protein D3925_09830, partial [Candidatus Electrothrix sp. AR5]|nr:hypothetical protein [Candidatus Electrothrix sp. AR5]
MSAPKQQLPGFWHFCWMFWMQPILLRQRLQSCGVDNPNARPLELLSAKSEKLVKHSYLRYNLLVMIMTPPLLLSFGVMAYIFLSMFLGLSVALVQPVVLTDIVNGLVFGIFFGYFLGLVGGVAVGTAVGVAIGFTLGIDKVLGLEMVTGAIYGMTGALAVRTVVGIAQSVAIEIFFGVLGSVSLGLVGMKFYGMPGGVGALLLFSFCFFGIHCYPFEVICQGLLVILQYVFHIPTLHFVPIHFYDLSYLPHPFLTQHIIHNIPIAPEVVKTTLDACGRSPGQKKVRAKVLPFLQAHELAEYIKTGGFQRAADLTGEWLPGRENAPKLLLALADTARFLQAADKALSPYHRTGHLNKAQTNQT